MAIVLFQRETLLPLSMQQCQQKSFINIIAPFLRIKHHNHGISIPIWFANGLLNNCGSHQWLAMGPVCVSFSVCVANG